MPAVQETCSVIEFKSDLSRICGGLSLDEIADLTFATQEFCFDDRPVRIRQFIEDDQYLGKYFSGEQSFFPFWMKILEKLYPTEFHSPCSEAIWSLPIGSGKTLNATVALLYEIYKLLCLKNPNEYYHLASGVRIVFALFSASLTLSADVNWNYFSALMASSPYFMKRCPVPTISNLKKTESVEFSKGVGIMLGSQATHALGKAVFGGLLDEANFMRSRADQAQENYTTIRRRRESRFQGMGGSIPGKLLLLSSPKHATDFLAEQINLCKSMPTVSITENIPIWEINKGTPRDVYSGETFRVYFGSARRDPFILKDGDMSPFEDGTTLDVPVEYRDSFDMDILGAIRDVAGRDLTSSAAFITAMPKLHQAATMTNRFTKQVMEIDFFDPEDRISEYVDKSYFTKISFPDLYRFVHCDLATTNDRLSVAASFAVSDKEQISPEAEKEVVRFDRTIFVDWVLCLQAKPGQQIPLYKVKDFLVYLKKIGYPIFQVSADKWNSADLLQSMKIAGMNTQEVSVDKTRIPYLVTRELLYRGKLLIPDHKLLLREFEQLRDDGSKIDHPTTGSKDCADAVAGSAWTCATSKVTVRPAGLFGQSSHESKVDNMLKIAQRQTDILKLAQTMFVNVNPRGM